MGIVKRESGRTLKAPSRYACVSIMELGNSWDGVLTPVIEAHVGILCRTYYGCDGDEVSHLVIGPIMELGNSWNDLQRSHYGCERHVSLDSPPFLVSTPPMQARQFIEVNW